MNENIIRIAKLVLIIYVLTIGAAICHAGVSSGLLANELIKQHEGFVSKPYIDVNHFSVGYGTNLMDGISRAEAQLLLTHRLAIREEQLKRYSWYKKANNTRKAVLLDMAYNLGLGGILGFKSMIWALDRGYYHGAANQLKSSVWCKQVKTRCTHLYKLMWNGRISSKL